MNIELKQRLVGAVVLVALAVIFIPMLLPGKGGLTRGISDSNIPSEPDYRFSPTPPAPVAPKIAAAPNVPMDDKSLDAEMDKTLHTKSIAKSTIKAAEKPKPAPVKKATSVTKTTSDSKVTKVAKAKSAPPVKEKSHKASGWVVQVGSFSSRANAKGLRDKLRKLGHACFVEEIKGESGAVYRVRVGPEVRRSSAEKLRKKLAEVAGLKGLVQAYP